MILRQIPKTIKPVLESFDLDSPAVTLALCLKCHSAYEPKFFPHNPTVAIYPDACTHVSMPGQNPCGEVLVDDRNRLRRPLLFWPPEEFIARLLSRSDLEDEIDAFADKAAQKANEDMPQMWSGMDDCRWVQTLVGPDGHTLFVKRPGTEGRIFFSLCYDGFDLTGLTLRGAKQSWGLWSLKCVSLPYHLQNGTTTMHPLMMIKTAKEIGHTMNNVMRPAMNCFKRGWHEGVRLSKTANHKNGRLVRYAIAHVCCDSKARPKLGGIGDITSHHCSMCEMPGKEGIQHWSAYDYENWIPRNIDHLREGAQKWRDAKTWEMRNQIFAEYRIKDPILLELPYFNTLQQLPVDGMHVIENLCAHQSQHILRITTVEKQPRPGAAFLYPFTPPVVAWHIDTAEAGNDEGLEDLMENVDQPGDNESDTSDDDHELDFDFPLPINLSMRFANLDLKKSKEDKEAFEKSVLGIHKRLQLGTWDGDANKLFNNLCTRLQKYHALPALQFVALDLGLEPLEGEAWNSAQPRGWHGAKKMDIAYALTKWVSAVSSRVMITRIIGKCSARLGHTN